jgi:hypothetical protein
MMSLAVLARCAAFGQAPSQQPAFEVASVKPAAPVEVQPGRPRPAGGLSSATGAGDPGLVIYSRVTLKAVLSKGMTEIQGSSDITLNASPETLPGLHGFGRPAPDADPKPSILAAVRELGLNLEPREASVKQLVVDSAEKIPTQN